MRHWICFLVFLPLQAFSAIHFSDTFSYPDGALTQVQADWLAFSGADQSVMVSDGVVSLGIGTEDISRSFAASDDLYFGLDLLVSTVDSSSEYAFGFRDGSTHDGGRWWLDGVNATQYRIGVSVDDNNEAFALAPTLLNVNESYRVVGYFNGADTAAVWISPSATDLASPEVEVSKPGASSTPDSFQLRQGAGWSGASWQVDHLTVASSFSEVLAPLPSPAVTSMLVVGVGLMPYARRKAKGTKEKQPSCSR